MRIATGGIRMNPSSTTVRRSKLKLDLPRMTMRLYVSACPATRGRWLGIPGVGCPIAELMERKPRDIPAVLLGEFAYAWVESPPGTRYGFGTFPPFEVRTVAFGSIPAKATVHIRQTMSDGRVDPLELVWYQSMTAVPKGYSVPGYGPPPVGSQGYQNNYLSLSGGISGPVKIRLSDVTVDGVPLKVGGHCETSTTTLNLTYEGGYFNMTKQLTGKIPIGETGSFAPLAVGALGSSGMNGSIDIPPFHGCITPSGENVSRLVTAMVSGANNPVVTHNSTILRQAWCAPILPVSPAFPGQLGHTYCPTSMARALRARGLSIPHAKALDSARSRRREQLGNKSVTDVIPKDLWEKIPTPYRKHIKRSLGMTG